MTAIAIQPAFQVFSDTDGSPLENGYIWIGQANLDPQTNPIAVYWDEALTILAAQPIRTLGGYPSWNGTPARLYAATSYSIRVLDAKGSLVYSAPDENGPLFGGTISSVDVTFLQAGAGAVERTAQSKLRDVVSVLDFGADPTGAADSTTAIQAAIAAAAGKALDFGDGLTFLVSSTLNLQSNSKYIGSSKIRAAASSIAGAVLDASNRSWVTISGLEIDANAANLGANHGIQLSAGSNNTITGCWIHDTLQAGIRAASETSLKIVGNRVISCGRTGYTDNHGVMAYATTGTLSDVQIVGNTVSNAFRKGITTYSAAPGLVRGALIEGNTVTGCGLGGIYTGNAPGGNAQQDVAIVGNRCSSNYVNIEADDLTVGVVDGNVLNGTSGGQGIYSADCLYTTISNNSVYNSQADGIKIIGLTINPSGLTVSANTVALSSQVGAGTYDGIDLNSVTYSTVVGNVILGESASPKQGYGIQESGTSDFNLYANNRIANTQTGTLAQFVGANNAIQSASGRQTGINAATPNNTLDINGGLSIRDQSITVANGANNNVALPSNAGTLYTAGPTGAYNISGIAGGVSGRKLTLVNYTAQTMTLNHNSGSSSAGNRILIGGSADLAISGFGAAELTYISGASAWVVTGVKT